MKKKVFSLCLGVGIGLFLFFCFTRIQHLFVDTTPNRTFQPFEGTSGRNRSSTGSINSGLDAVQLDTAARQLNISTGKLQSLLNSGATLKELLQQANNQTGNRTSSPILSGRDLSAEEILRSVTP